MRILLIDDEVRKARATVDYFREVCDWNVDFASGPDSALEMLKTTHDLTYDVIILDVMMDPGTAIPRERSGGGRDTGLVLLESINRLTGGSIMVVLYTARTDLDHLKNERKVAGYIQKPRTVRELAREIEDLIAERRL